MANTPVYIKRPRSVDLLDHMLNHTTLTTKRVTHNHILGRLISITFICVLITILPVIFYGCVAVNNCDV